MFGIAQKYIMNSRLSPALKTRRLRRGMDYFRFLVVCELRKKNTPKAYKMEKLLMNNHKSDLIQVFSGNYKGFSQEFTKVKNLYPMIISEILSIFAEIRAYAHMANDTVRFHPNNPLNSNEAWLTQLSDQILRLNHLYYSYPNEIGNIFQAFAQSEGMQEMYDASLDIRYYGSFERMVLFISYPNNRQLGFIEETSYFMSFCELASGKRF